MGVVRRVDGGEPHIGRERHGGHHRATQLYAQQIYQSLSDADATEAAAFLAVTEPPAARADFHADIERAGSYLRAVTAADPAPAARSP